MKSLRVTVVVSILFLTLFGSVLYFSQSVLQAREAVKKTLAGDLTTVVKQVSNEVEIQIQSKYDLMRAIGNQALFQNPDITNDEKQDQLDVVGFLDPDLIGINIMDMQGNLRVAGAGYLNFSEDPYFTEPAKGNNAILGPLVNTVTNEMTMFYGSPIKDPNGRVMNTLLIAANGDILCEVCEKVKIGTTGNAMIIDRDMQLIVGDKNRDLVIQGASVKETLRDNPIYKDLAPQIDNLLAGKIGGGFYKENGKLKYISYCPVAGTSFSSAVTIDYSEYQVYLKGLRDRIFFISILVIILGFVISMAMGANLRPLGTLATAINNIASGNADLTQRLEIKHTKKEIKDVVSGFNAFIEKLQGIVANIKESENRLSSIDESLQQSTNSTTENIENITSNISDVNAQIANQGNSVQGTASAVNEIASNIESLERMIDNQATGVAQASSAVEEMVGNINSVNASVERMVSSFKELEENATVGIQTQDNVNERIQQIQDQSDMLQEANTAIANIAEQTNLLAMNAAIEAAHAGEAGKGFSVVADEIRKLSETSTAQSKRIGEELGKIQDSISQVVQASTRSTAAFTTVSSSIKHTDEIIHQIKVAMEEQQIGSKQITNTLMEMNESTSEVKNAAAEMTEGNKLILREVQLLQTATMYMQESINNMTDVTNSISESGGTLADISNKVTDSINQIRGEINQFKV